MEESPDQEASEPLEAKIESSDACFEPVHLKPAAPFEARRRAYPAPDFSVSMEIRLQLKDASKVACSNPYLDAASVKYQTLPHGVTDHGACQVCGLGGFQVMCRAPNNPTRVWKISRLSQDNEREFGRLMGPFTPMKVRALGVHRIREEGSQGVVFWGSILESELVEPCPEVTESLVFQLMFAVAMAAKFVHARDLVVETWGRARSLRTWHHPGTRWCYSAPMIGQPADRVRAPTGPIRNVQQVSGPWWTCLRQA